MERKMSDEEYLRLSMKARRGSLTVEEHQASVRFMPEVEDGVEVRAGTFQEPVLVNGEARFDVMDRKGRKMTLQYKKGRIGTTGDDGIVNWFEYQR